jgi:PPP family 3-phenylpropionic acid transporter
VSPGTVVLTSGVAYGLYFGAIGAWSPYWPVYFQQLGVELAAIGVLTAIPAVVQIFGAPAWGMIADRLGDVRLPLAAAAVLVIAAALFLASEPPIALLFPGVALLAVGTSAWAPLIDARTVVALGAHRDRYGQARAVGSAGFIVASVLVGLLIDAHGARSLFAAYIPLITVAGVWVVTLFGQAGTRQRVTGVGPMGAFRLLRDRSMTLLFAGSVIVWAASSGASAFLSLRLIAQGADAGLIGVGWAVNAIVEVPMMLVFRRLARRTGVPALITAGAAVLAIRTLGWALAGSAVATVGVALLSGIGFSLFLVGVTTWLADRVPTALRATAQALFLGTAYAIGTILGALGAGWAAGASGLDAMFYEGALLAALGTVVTWTAVGRPGWPGRPSRLRTPRLGREHASG